MESFQTDTASGIRPTTAGGCGCTGGGRRRRHTRRGGVGMVDDALLVVGTSYAADKWGRKKSMGGRRRRTSKRGGAGLVDDAIVAGSALTLAHYFAKKRGGRSRRTLPRRLTKKSLV
jgi:hypothetical protein